MLQTLPELSPFQFSLVYNMFSFTIAAMFSAFVFFVMARQNLAPKYRISMMVSSLVVFIAGYHYFRIFNSWEAAYMLNEATQMYEYSGEPFNDAYRYVDWLLTVPLLVVELVIVMGLPKGQSGRLMASLGFAAALMIILGYPGEVAEDVTWRLIWGTASTLPFLYIVWKLFFGLGDAIDKQPPRPAKLLENARLLLLATWGFYPIVYLIGAFVEGYPSEAPGAVVAIQVGYTLADVFAKAGYGVLIYAIAKAKSEAEGFNVEEMVRPERATTSA
jgi:bacteriorhodopsin